MKILKNMTVIKSSAGFTAVNPKFSFSNTPVLTSEANSNKSSTPIARNISKITNPVDDSKRFSDIVINPVVVNNIVLPKAMPSFFPSVPSPAARPLSGSINLPSSPLSPLESQPRDANNTSLTIRTNITTDELRIFSSGSFLNAIGTNLDESSTGQLMNKASKCKILGIIAEDVVDGYPTSNVLFFKKSDSETVQPKLYTVLRKNLFTERDYKKLIEIKPEDTQLPPQYAYILEDFDVPEKDVFAIKDTSIKTNTSYIYKIMVSWTPKVVPTPTSSSAPTSTLTSPSISSVISSTQSRA